MVHVPFVSKVKFIEAHLYKHIYRTFGYIHSAKSLDDLAISSDDLAKSSAHLAISLDDLAKSLAHSAISLDDLAKSLAHSAISSEEL